MFARRHTRDDHLDIGRLTRFWHGDSEEEYGEAAVIGTAAIALHLMQRAPTPEAATELAREMWRSRNRAGMRAAA